MNPKVIPYIGRFPRDEYVRRLMLCYGGYWLGTIGQTGTLTVWNQKRVQEGLEKWYIDHANAFDRWKGVPVQDCIGVDKGIRWGNGTWDGNVPYRGDIDLNETSLYNLAIELNLRRGAISTIPKETGLCVGFKGHIGFTQEIKDGKIYVKESRGGDWGVVVYELGKRPGTTQQFEYWYENPFVDYDNGGSEMLKKGDVGSAVYGWQKLLMFWNPLALPQFKADRDFGNETEVWTKKLQAAYKLIQTGIVDDKTWDAMLSVINKVKTDLTASVALVATRDKTITGLNASLATKDASIASLNAQIVTKDKAIASATTTIAARDKSIASLTALVAERDKTIGGMIKSNADLEKQLLFADGDIDELQKALTASESLCDAKDRQVADLTIIIEDNMDTMKAKDDEIVRLSISTELLNEEIKNHKATEESLSTQLTIVTELLHTVEAELKAIKEAPPVVEEPVEYSTKELLHMLIDSIFKK